MTNKVYKHFEEIIIIKKVLEKYKFDEKILGKIHPITYVSSSIIDKV
jgi:hypothetical protein